MKKGFTLIEIMIAVAIIAILASIAIPSFAKYRREAQAAVCAAQKNSLKIASEHWLSKNPDAVRNEQAPTLDQLAPEGGGGYFKSQPQCPCCDEDYQLTFNTQTKAIDVTCPEHDAGSTPTGDYGSPMPGE